MNGRNSCAKRNGKQRWARPAGWQKPTAGDVLLDGSPFHPASVLSGTAVPQHPELTFNPGEARDAVRDARQPRSGNVEVFACAQPDIDASANALPGGSWRVLRYCARLTHERFLIADEMTAQPRSVYSKAIWVLSRALSVPQPFIRMRWRLVISLRYSIKSVNSPFARWNSRKVVSPVLPCR